MKKVWISEELMSALRLSSEGFVIIENSNIIWMNESAEEIFDKPEWIQEDRTIDSILS